MTKNERIDPNGLENAKLHKRDCLPYITAATQEVMSNVVKTITEKTLYSEKGNTLQEKEYSVY